MTQPPDDAALVARLRKRLAEASEQPWVYRPNQHDDWGWIRGVERDDRGIGPFRPIVANGKDSLVRDEDMDAHRRAKTDPYGPNALLIVDAVNALPGLLDALEAKDRRIETLEAALRAIAEGNLGDLPWQANYDRLKDYARAALEPSDKGVG
jgi:hypothetical protein